MYNQQQFWFNLSLGLNKQPFGFISTAWTAVHVKAVSHYAQFEGWAPFWIIFVIHLRVKLEAVGHVGPYSCWAESEAIGSIFRLVAVLNQCLIRLKLELVAILDLQEWAWQPFAIHFSPGRVYKADVVEFGPASKHLFFSNEAMMISTATPLILQVRYTLIRPSGFIVVVWHSLGLRMPPIPQRLHHIIII